MFRYAVRIDGDSKSGMASLVDWPQVCVPIVRNISFVLKEKLLMAISDSVRSGTVIPVPRTRPADELCVHLSTAESLKVLVLNEVHASGVDMRFLARDLGVTESAIRRALDLGRSTDVDFLSEVLTVMGRRLLAYTTAM